VPNWFKIWSWLLGSDRRQKAIRVGPLKQRHCAELKPRDRVGRFWLSIHEACTGWYDDRLVGAALPSIRGSLLLFDPVRVLHHLLVWCIGYIHGPGFPDMLTYHMFLIYFDKFIDAILFLHR
jgi:hypothetical protein